MKTNPPDRTSVVKELEERLLKKWKKQKAADTASEKDGVSVKPIVIPQSKKTDK